MDYPHVTDFKEELKKEGLNDEEIEILKDIYIGQNIYEEHGILRHDFYKFGTKLISLLLEHDYIEEVQWYSHHLYHTTGKGSKIGRIVVTNLIDEKRSELEDFLNKQPQKVLNFVIQEHIVKKEYEKFTYPVQSRDLSVLGSNNWIEPFIVDSRIHTAWTSVLFGLEVLGLCVRTNKYVATRGGELREENYVISSEGFDFLMEHCPKEGLTEEEYENCKLYDVLQYSYRYQEGPLEVFRDAYWDRLRDVRLEEAKVKEAIDRMEEMGITSEYRGLLGSKAPFSIKDKSRYCIWLEKTLKDPVIKSLLEVPKPAGEKGKIEEIKPIIKPIISQPTSDLNILLGRDEKGKNSPDNTFWFDIALSFAGEHRAVAENIAQELKQSNVSLFYDKFEQSKLWGKRLSKHFQEVYGPKTRFVVVLISKEYPVKDWTDFEFTIAREEARHRKNEFILPVRIDDTHISGLPSDVAYLDLNEVGVKGVVKNILIKLDLPSATIPPEPTRLVATFGVSPEVIEEQIIKLGNVPSPYIKICDKLEQDLSEILNRLNLPRWKFTEASNRAGETLSVRICFIWDLQKGFPVFGNISPWEILEIKPFESIYPISDESSVLN